MGCMYGAASPPEWLQAGPAFAHNSSDSLEATAILTCRPTDVMLGLCSSGQQLWRVVG
jgi:hypothetical protein